MATDRLTPLDSSFLHLEDASTHMHVASVMIFDGSPPPYENFLEHLGSRLHLVPRYRQKLAWVPFDQGRPKWIDDPGFDLRYHVRATGLPRPGGEYELQVLAGRVFGHQLNRDKPLWETWLVEGLEGDRFAILSKTHHALVDGISGLDILSVLFSPDADPGDAQWRPRPAPSGIELLVEALWERATMPAEFLRPVYALARRPGRVLAGLMSAFGGLGALASPAPPTPYNAGTIGADRRFTWVRCSLGDFKGIKNVLGGTVNDVVLAVVARALRRHLLERGSQVEELRAFVPVSVRTEEQAGTLGNRVSAMIARLPIACSDPFTCLTDISEQMRELKDSGQAVSAEALTELADFAPPNLFAQAARVLARQRFFNLVVTNVPGPQVPLHLHGRELVDIFPMVPLARNQALGVAILSYNGGMNFGLVGDFDLMPDLEEVAAHFDAALRELADAAGVQLRGRAREGEGTADEAASRAPETASGPAAADEAPSAQAPSAQAPSAEAPSAQAPGAEAPEGTADEALPALAEVEAHAHGPDRDATLVGEYADPQAGDGPGPQVRVEEPWPGYRRMKAVEVAQRLTDEPDEVAAVVRLYESTHRRRRLVLQATERALAGRTS
jgi:diacylglycerol O-acyltransferase / wax synthase